MNCEDILDERVYYTQQENQANLKQFENLIEQINTVGQKQYSLQSQIKDKDLEQEENYKNFLELLDINFEKMILELNLVNFYKKNHPVSKSNYEFIILSALNTDNMVKLIEESLRNHLKRRIVKGVILRVRIVSKCQQGRKLPLICHNGYYQILDNKKNILIEFTSMKRIKDYLSENKFYIKEIILDEVNSTGNLRNCHFEWGNLK